MVILSFILISPFSNITYIVYNKNRGGAITASEKALFFPFSPPEFLFCIHKYYIAADARYAAPRENIVVFPAQKPEKLLAKLILASSREGDVVLDPFGGSHSTAVTAKKLGRRFVSIEKNPLYCAWGENRLELADADKTIQGYDDGVFWERNTASYILAKRQKANNMKKKPTKI